MKIKNGEPKRKTLMGKGQGLKYYEAPELKRRTGINLMKNVEVAGFQSPQRQRREILRKQGTHPRETGLEH